ncbi:MAG: alpha-hydroxy acid oxidase [Pseudomonadota bacterium]
MRLVDTHPSINDLAARAKRRVPHFVWEYLASGTGEEGALVRNRAALDAVTLVPAALQDPPTPRLETELLGETQKLPFGFAPVGMSGLIWPGAEAMLARAANAAGIPYCLSTVAAATPEEIGPLTEGKGWFQLYAPGAPEIRKDLLDRARAAGFRTLVLTADLPTASRRERLRRAGITNPMRITPRVLADCARRPAWSLAVLKNGMPRLATLEAYADTSAAQPGTAHVGYQMRTAPDLDYLKALRDLWDGPLVVKGVLDPEFCGQLDGIGVDAIWVSNHGGRQFDAAPAAIDALPEVKAAAGALPVLFDSGILSATDILRAFALGADYTFLGRAPHYALAAFGNVGISHMISILKTGLEADLGQLGIAHPAEALSRRPAPLA